LPQLHRRMLDVLGIKHPDKLVPLPDDQKPKDPVSENMACLKGEPMKAFQYQDHDSHIKVHMSMIQDPLIQQTIGQNPRAPQIQAALMAHIGEHVGFAYRQKIEQQLGMPLPPEDEKLPPQIELALSGMMAQAANQVLQQSQAQAAQQQAQQQAQDPVLQMQQQELQIEQQKVQIQGQKVQADIALAKQKLILEGAEKHDRLEMEKKKMLMAGAEQHDRLGLEQKKLMATQGEDPRIAAARAQQELASTQAKNVMAAQQHNQNLTHKQEVHRQNLKHQREQAAIRADLARNQPEEKPKK